MSWAQIVRAPHPCKTPLAKDIKRIQAGSGSRWSCPRCRSVWVLWLDTDWPALGSVALWDRQWI